MSSAFDLISVDILVYLFNFLNIKDLCRLRCTCRKFNEIITTWDNIFLKKYTPVIANQNNEKFAARCVTRIDSKLEKLRIENIWKKLQFEERSINYGRNSKYMTCLHLTKENLWMSRGKIIYNYSRNQKYGIERKSKELISIPQRRGNIQNDGFNRKFLPVEVTKFSINNDILATGLTNGGIYVLNLQNNQTFLVQLEDTYVNSIDISHDNRLISSGLRNNRLSIFALDSDNDSLDVRHLLTKDLKDRPWSLSFSDTKPLLLCGLSAHKPTLKLYNKKTAIKLFDTTCFEEVQSFQDTDMFSSVLGLKWDDESHSGGGNCFWSCGNDGSIYRWDLRTGTCVSELFDIYGSGIYCFDYDNCNTIIAGSHLHARIAFWDIRFPKQCLETYFLRSSRNETIRSPVYSICFDSHYLFAGLESNLNILRAP